MVFLSETSYFCGVIKKKDIVMKERLIHVMASSNLGTRIQLTLFAETDDLRDLISDALSKLSQYCTRDEQFKIDHIDSIVYLQEPEM